MKKIILLLFFFICVPFIITSKMGSIPLLQKETIENSKNLKDENWEYIKDRLFDGETQYVHKISGPILIVLKNAKKQDSIAVQKTMLELKKILPHKTIDYYKNYTNVSFHYDLSGNRRIKNTYLYELYSSVIILNFKKSLYRYQSMSEFNSSILNDGTIIKRLKRYRKKFDTKKLSLRFEDIFFLFSNTTSLEKKSEYIQYEFFRWLCFINSEKRYFPSKYKTGIFNTPEYLPEKGKLNYLDKFLLQKLYSETFLSEFKDYLHKTYPWRYTNLFISKKSGVFNVYLITLTIGLFIFITSFFLIKNLKSNYFIYFLSLLIFNLSLIYLSNIYFYLVELNSIITWKSNFQQSIFLGILLSFITGVSLSRLERLFIKNNYKFLRQIILKFLFTFLFLNTSILLFIYKKNQTNIIEEFLYFLVLSGVLSFLRCIYIYLNYYSESLIKQKDVELSQLKELQAATELHSLHAQVNPHFLYNALNSIASLAHINTDKTEKMALSLSDLFRYSINRKGEKMSTIKEEVEMVENYLEIEKIRFEDRLEFSVDVEAPILETYIPRFMLQPLIENAVKHGISNIEGKGNIHLTITKSNNDLLISVSDNGPHFPDGLVSGHGLQSVYDLLRLSYNEQASMNWGNLPKKKITISIRSNS